MTREITHMKAFTAAPESMNKPRFVIGRIPPTPGLVDQFFNDSTGAGEDGEIDARGPWNSGSDVQFVEALAFQEMRSPEPGMRDRVGDRTTSSGGDVEMIEELLVEQLRDLFNAEGQLVKALPKMVAAARSEGLRVASIISTRRRNRSSG
jgi:Mn-containing catalase